MDRGKILPYRMELNLLTEWFEDTKRDLPWRNAPTPYQVWVSEIMLQQTQVSVVLGYYEKWMQKFPTIEALASSSLDDVMKVWEGLGYYSRARNLHEGAKYVMGHFSGNLPSVGDELKKIKGLGPYTIGAILSFAFNKRAPAVDGNVIRVLSRYFFIEEDVCQSKTIEKLRGLTEQILPETRPWVAMEALIELGAMICLKKPTCFKCPIRLTCKAFIHGKAHLLPIKGTKTKITSLKRAVAVLTFKDEILIKKQEEKKIMAGLYEFPYVEGLELKTFLKNELKINAEFQEELPQFKHSFTRFRAELFPSLWRVFEKKQVEGFEWINFSSAQKLPFSSGHRRIFNFLKQHEYFTH